MLLAGPTRSTGDDARLRQVVRDTILANPEILREAALRLQSRETGRLVADNRRAFETPFPGALAGNPRGDVTLVAFFDYACGFCRTSVPHIDRLIAADKSLRVVYRELPVLGPDSEAAAHAALAAANTGKYVPFHNQLFAAGRPLPATVARVARANNVTAAATPDTRAEIARNVELARAVGITGTPGFVVGDQIFTGAVGFDSLKAAIADARAKRT